tara:strand:- start:4142 stop:4267 length:126 start_codon:yes stop_codon:yes gene_type:complete
MLQISKPLINKGLTNNAVILMGKSTGEKLPGEGKIPHFFTF